MEGDGVEGARERVSQFGEEGIVILYDTSSVHHPTTCLCLSLSLSAPNTGLYKTTVSVAGFIPTEVLT